MSIFDTFTLIWESDASKLDKGIADSDRKAGDLNKSLKDIDRNAGKMGGSLAPLLVKLAGAIGLAAGAKSILSSSIARANDVHLMNQTAESIGVAVEEMDAFRRALEDTGGTAQGAQSSLQKMSQAIGQSLTDVNSQQAKTFKRIGMSLKDASGQTITATEAMANLAGSVEGLGKAQARFAIRQLGIEDSATIELLLKGRNAVIEATKAHKEQGVVTKDMAIQAARLDDSMNKLRGGLDRAALKLMNALLPAIIKGTDWLEKMVRWATENKDVLIAFFTAVAGIVATVYLPAMMRAATATLAATWPIVAIVGIIAGLSAAFALLYDDIMNYIDGNDSLIGQIFDKFPALEKIVLGVIAAVKQAWEAIKEFGGELLDAIAPLADAFGPVFEQMGNNLRLFGVIVTEIVKLVAKAFGVDMEGSVSAFGFVVGKVFDGIVSAVKLAVSFLVSALGIVAKVLAAVGSGYKAVAGWLGAANSNEPKNEQPGMIGRAWSWISGGNKAVDQANASPLNATTSGAISNSQMSRENNVQVGEVVINTQATDAQGISSDIGGALQKELENLDYEYSSGLRR